MTRTQCFMIGLLLGATLVGIMFEIALPVM